MPTDTDKVADLAVARNRQRQAEAAARKAVASDEATHHDLAAETCEHLAIDGHTLKYDNGSLWLPDPSGLWRQVSHEQFNVTVARHHGGRKLCKKHSDFKQITEHTAALCEANGYFDAAPVAVVTPQGLHTLSAAGCIETAPLSLAHRQTFSLAHAPDYEAESKLLDGVLEQAFEGDDPKGQADLWWQAVGASLFGLMPRLQTVVLMLGRERSGKSLLQRVLESAFPAEAVCAVSPASWGHEYHVAALAGKRINVVGELSDDSPIPAASFKNVTGQNLVGGRHPTHRPFSFRCLAAHWFASNVLPPTTDRSEAFYRRWRVLRFANTVPADKVDPGLFEKIVADEMPAILGNAFLGAERVARAGAIRISAAHTATLDRWRLSANPLQQFLADDEWVELDPATREHGTPEVYETYRKWSASCGFRNPFGRNHFLELLDSTGATRGVGIKRTGSKTVVVGLRLVPRNQP